MAPEAPLEQTEHGLVPERDGWFVVNAREARWLERPGRGMRRGFGGEERALTQWDFVHCPAGADHIIAGADPRPARCRDGSLPRG